MGGINSLSGLNNVSVDFRPTVTTDVQNTGNANQPQPGANAVPEEVPQPERAQAKSVVRELDVLLLHAAGKSISAEAAEEVKVVGKSLFDKGVLTEKEASKLQSLAEDATETLRALDKFSGRDLAKALMQDGKVYGKEQWRNEANLNAMTGFKATVTIKKSDGSTIKVDNNVDCVKEFNERRCPSFFRREFLQNMFNPPEAA